MIFPCFIHFDFIVITSRYCLLFFFFFKFSVLYNATVIFRITGENLLVVEQDRCLKFIIFLILCFYNLILYHRDCPFLVENSVNFITVCIWSPTVILKIDTPCIER